MPESENEYKQVTFKAEARLGKRERTPEGYLKAEAALTRVGVQDIYGSELGLEGDAANSSFGILLDRDVIFSDSTIESARKKPVTFGHPDQPVTSENYSAYAVGHVGDDVREIEGGRLGASLILTDPVAIAAVERGVEEVSIASHVLVKPDEGAREGRQYQFRGASPLQINHAAIVDKGRAGRTVRILSEEKPMTDEELRKLVGEAVAAAMAEDDSEDDEDRPGVDAEAVANAVAEKLGPALERQEDEEERDDEQESDDAGEGDDEAVRERVSLIQSAAPLLPKDAKPHTMSRRELMLAALGDSVKDADEHSDEYLKGRFEAQITSRQKADSERKRITANLNSEAGSGKDAGTPMNFIDMRRYYRKEGK